ncbi:hypothetical protein F4811DRAFT_550911 [Daldinia bambusicola]|nr:hypothetical protein F4811DRAFT_550911 [Daldinia bambusicola]
MKLSLALTSLWLALALGQQIPECSRELAATDDCADVINANACYNQFRFRNNQTLSCIGGANNDERAKKAWQSERASVAVASAARCAIG